MTPDHLCNLAIEAERAGDPSRAIVHYQLALRLQPDHQQAMFNYAAFLLQGVRDVSSAASLAARHHQLHPSDAGRRLLGLCRLEQGRTANALALLPEHERRFYSLMISGGHLIDQKNCPCGCGAATRWNPPTRTPERRKPERPIYGLLNKPCKATEMTGVWKRIADETDGRFVAFALGGEGNRDVRAMYERGIPANRLKLIDYVDNAGFLDVASRVTAMLDTYPFNGILTMRDCLHVGTPVVCLPGHQRTAVSAVIPSEHLVGSEEDYVRRAVRLGGVT